MEHSCAVCGAPYRKSYALQQTCGRKCGMVIQAQRRGWKRPTCVICGGEFKKTYPAQSTCTRACGVILQAQNLGRNSVALPWRNCAGCTVLILRGKRCKSCDTEWRRPTPDRVCLKCGTNINHLPRSKYCSAHCRESSEYYKQARRRLRRRETDRQRARRYGVPYEPIDRRKVYERDCWTCHICGDTIDKDSVAGSDWGASLDHVIPMSKGGPHTYANVKAAHQWCNSAKGTDEFFDLRVA